MTTPRKKRELVPDALQLNNLKEAELLQLVSERYVKRMIYTFVGPTIVIAMNPFRDFGASHLEKLYSHENMKRYQPASSPTNEPHIYSIGANALRQLGAHKKNQAILITGESGAGKTESTKILLRYFADMTGALSGIGYDKSVPNTLESRLSEMNYILEAFGNACTSRNHNSSRFGKWIELVYDRQRNLKHAQLKSYVLESARVVLHNESERNFHIFYRLFQDASKDQCNVLNNVMKEFDGFCSSHGIKPLETKYVAPTKVSNKENTKLTRWQDSSHKAKSVSKDDLEDGPDMIRAFDNYGLGEYKHDIYSMILGIILIGCIEFVLASDGASGQLSPQSEKLIPQISKYIGFSQSDLKLYLTKTMIRDQVMGASLTKCQAARTAMAKTLYDRLFVWLVSIINSNLTQQATKDEGDRFIGLLDIAGFEAFDLNGLDQLLINFNNENLQRIFNLEFIAHEIEVYEAEGISNVGMDVKKTFEQKDNIVVIRAIEGYKGDSGKKFHGVFDVLVETMKSPGNEDKKDLAFVGKLYSKPFEYLVKKHDEQKPKIKIRRAKFGQENFVIEHYAADVSYNVGDGWMEKIKMSLTPLFESAVTNSSAPVLKQMFEGIPRDNKANLIEFYLKDIHSLLDSVDTCDRQYIRTIKPNVAMNYSDGIENDLVKPQLSCSGVMEAVKIRQGGHGFRETYRNLVMSFCEILSEESRRGGESYGEELKRNVKENSELNPVSEFKKLIKKAMPIAKEESAAALHRDSRYFSDNEMIPYDVALSDDNVAWGKTMFFCKHDPRTALNIVLNRNLKARFEREVFARRLKSAFIWYKTKEERLVKERSVRIFEDCLKWKTASDKAQKRVPDVKGGLFLYPKSIIGGVKDGGHLVKSASMFNTLVKALIKLDRPEHVKHVAEFQKIAHRMVTEGNCILRAGEYVENKRPADTYSVAQYKGIYDLIQEAKRHSIYNPIFDNLNKLASEIKYNLKDDPRLQQIRAK
eukprot:GHVH01003613.1.p1 GENE.GHVH01003613.1~~GHVH01003613.1.p1  ORF type:complete len:982 (+),score=183.35 GHVH01003613.1:1707-4652(+)